MKVHNPIDSRSKARKILGPLTEEGRRKKAQKALEKADYTPQAARFLSGVLRALATGPPMTRTLRLSLFQVLSDPFYGD